MYGYNPAISYQRVLITAPAVEPLEVSEVKDHLRITWADEDEGISRRIKVARQNAEAYLGRALITQTWDIYYRYFWPCFELPFGSLQSVTYIKYTDPDGTLQTVSSSLYAVDTTTTLGTVEEAYNQSWPGDVRDFNKAIVIRFVCGYGTAGTDVPEPIREAMLIDIGHRHENREAVNVGQGFTALTVPLGWSALLDTYRIYTL